MAFSPHQASTLPWERAVELHPRRQQRGQRHAPAVEAVPHVPGRLATLDEAEEATTDDREHDNTQVGADRKNNEDEEEHEDQRPILVLQPEHQDRLIDVVVAGTGAYHAIAFLTGCGSRRRCMAGAPR